MSNAKPVRFVEMCSDMNNTENINNVRLPSGEKTFN